MDQAKEYYEQGNKLCDSGDKVAAIEAYDKAIELNPKYAFAFLRKGNTLAALGRNQDAIEVYDNLIEIKPDYSLAYHNKGLALYHLKQYEAAIEAYDKSIELKPKYAIAYNNKGECFTELGQYEKAVEAYTKCIELDQNHKLACGNKGFALYHLGSFEDSIECYDLQIKIRPEGFLSYAKKGKALQALGRNKEASECYSTADDLIRKGKLDGSGFTDHLNQTIFLNKLEVQLVTDLKELGTIPAIETTGIQSEELKTEAIKLAEKKEALTQRVFDNLVDAQKSNDMSMLEQLRQEIQNLKNENLKLAERVAVVESDIQDSGTKDVAEVKRGFKALDEQDPELFAYCKTFYWSTLNLLNAYRTGSTGLLKADTDLKVSNKDHLPVIGVEKAAKAMSLVVTGIPFVGGFVKLFDSIIEGIYESQFEYKANVITKVVQAKFGMEDDISIGVAKLALAMTRVKEKIILYPEIAQPGKLEKGFTWLGDQVGGVKDKVLPSIEVYDEASYGAQLALQDVALFMAYLFKNYKAVIKRKEPLDKQIEAIVEFGALDAMLEEKSKEKPSEEKVKENSSEKTSDEMPQKSSEKSGRECTCAMF